MMEKDRRTVENYVPFKSLLSVEFKAKAEEKYGDKEYLDLPVELPEELIDEILKNFRKEDRDEGIRLLREFYIEYKRTKDKLQLSRL